MKKKKSWANKKFVGEWAKALERHIHRQADEVPKGFVTAEVALTKMGLCGAASGQRTGLLNKMVVKGALIKKHYRVIDATGRRISSIAHYAIAK
jgi:hypothetical protein